PRSSLRAHSLSSSLRPNPGCRCITLPLSPPVTLLLAPPAAAAAFDCCPGRCRVLKPPREPRSSPFAAAFHHCPCRSRRLPHPHPRGRSRHLPHPHPPRPEPSPVAAGAKVFPIRRRRPSPLLEIG
ncbi:hypothetical protein EE612_027705, partial [Oryza sativa]